MFYKEKKKKKKKKKRSNLLFIIIAKKKKKIEVLKGNLLFMMTGTLPVIRVYSVPVLLWPVTKVYTSVKREGFYS